MRWMTINAITHNLATAPMVLSRQMIINQWMEWQMGDFYTLSIVSDTPKEYVDSSTNGYMWLYIYIYTCIYIYG